MSTSPTSARDVPPVAAVDALGDNGKRRGDGNLDGVEVEGGEEALNNKMSISGNII